MVEGSDLRVPVSWLTISFDELNGARVLLVNINPFFAEGTITGEQGLPGFHWQIGEAVESRHAKLFGRNSAAVAHAGDTTDDAPLLLRHLDYLLH